MLLVPQSEPPPDPWYFRATRQVRSPAGRRPQGMIHKFRIGSTKDIRYGRTVLHGVPPRSRLRRTLLAALVTASVVVPVSGAARPAAVPAPAPAALAPMRAVIPAALHERYAANRDAIRAAERMAAGHGDRRRAAVLRSMADLARQRSTRMSASGQAPWRSSRSWAAGLPSSPGSGTPGTVSPEVLTPGRAYGAAPRPDHLRSRRVRARGAARAPDSPRRYGY